MLSVEAVDLYYGASHALRRVSLTANKGEVTCILGRNGVGKTSLLRAILGLARDRTIVIVEHDMAFVRSLGAKVTVLHEGSVLAEGSVEHVQNHPRVIEVYLGR